MVNLLIEDVKHTFDLLKMIDCTSYCKASDLAKELKISKTDMMQYILNFPKLFQTRKIEIKKKSYFVIDNIYLNAYENPNTDEWLNKQKEDKKHYIHLQSIDYYGYIYGYYIPEDKDRLGEWRNTKEKIDYLREQGIVKEKTFTIGSMSDCYYRKEQNAITEESLENLKNIGWTFTLN